MSDNSEMYQKNLPSTELKTWVLVPVRNEWEPIYVTTQQMEAISRAWKNNVMAELRDSATGNLKEVLYRTDWRPRPVKVDYKAEREKAGKRWVCDYGQRHPMSMTIIEDRNGDKQWTADCPCGKELGITADEFLAWCNKKYGVDHSYYIKPHMYDEYMRLKTITPKETHV